jgi:ribonuclease BN (tRNA processing enzyme)
VRIVPLGVRGSTPAPGRDFVRYGGHTSCVAVFGENDDVPALVLDAGTGLRSLPALLGGRPFCGDIVLTHLHWDHVQGLPFTPSVDRRDAEVTLHVPVPSVGIDPSELLGRAMSPPHFPIGPDGLLGKWRFEPLSPGPLKAGGAALAVSAVDHKGGTTFGVRVELDGASLVYLPDHALTDAAGESTRQLVEGADLLLHDGQFVAGERSVASGYGHATIEAVVRLADECGVGELVLTHHAPSRTDAQLDALAAAISHTPHGRPVRFARQDEMLDVRLAG